MDSPRGENDRERVEEVAIIERATKAGAAIEKTTSKVPVMAINMEADKSRKTSQKEANSSSVSTALPNNKLQQPIKKACVRFDDYLNSNGENMQRSCKQLMNHLYSDSGSLVVAPAISSQRPIESQTPTGAPIKFVANAGAKTKSSLSNAGKLTGRRSLPPTPSPTPPTITSEKSYLRSQFERRQQRQLQMMNKMQQASTTTTTKMTTMTTNTILKAPAAPVTRVKVIASGADPVAHNQKQRQQQPQQDSVAKSHELSKRRFFEKLERRESIRGLEKKPTAANFGGSMLAPDTKAQAQAATLPPIISYCNLDGEQTQPKSSTNVKAAHQDKETEGKQKSLGDEELMLKLYQSIVFRGCGTVTSSNEQVSSNKDTLGDSAEAQTDDCCDGGCSGRGGSAKQFAGELIGFYTPSQQSPADKQERLIEFSVSEQAMPGLRQLPPLVAANSSTMAALAADPFNESNFEIKVPPVSSMVFASSNQQTEDSSAAADGFISSGLLVVKQVEVAELGKRSSTINATNANTSHRIWSRATAASTATVGPPTLSGRYKEEVSTQVAANKKKTPLDESTDNKLISPLAARINGQSEAASTWFTSAETMATTPVRTPEICRSLTSIVSDNHHHIKQHQTTADISSTISIGNKMEAIPSLVEVKESATTSVADSSVSCSNNTGAFERLVKATRSSGRRNNNNKLASDSQCGESNRAENHDVPETRTPVKQSAGTRSGLTADAAIENKMQNSNSAYPVERQSAALVQQVVGIKATTVTEPEIRDVLPEANGISRMEAIVSAPNGASVTATTTTTAEKVIANPKQVSRELQQRQQPIETKVSNSHDEYVNLPAANDVVQKNNVNCDSNEVLTKANAVNTNESVHDGNENENEPAPEQVIESSNMQHSNILASNCNNFRSVHGPGSGTEDDGGSSCSSSGFGASVSVTGSSDAGFSNSINEKLSTSTATLSQSKHQLDSRRPALMVIGSRVAIVDQEPAKSNPLYDCVRAPKNWTRATEPSSKQSFLADRQSVGPDQAYPKASKGCRTLLIENHGYASVLDHHNDSSSPPSFALEPNIVLERDELVEGYANVSKNNKIAPIVEYATVRNPQSLIVPESSKKPLNSSSSGASLSGLSLSTGSAKSGGFSALAPARVECASANNFESLVSLTEEAPQQRKSSLLKRFGSLVSKAFTGAAGGDQVSAPSKINESSTQCSPSSSAASPAASKLECEQQNHANGMNSEPKSALVIEHNKQQHHKVAASVAHADERQIGEADLVILPTKHVNQRKSNSNNHQSKQKEQSPLRRHDDRLSRDRKLSRNMKQSDSSSVTSASSSFPSSPSSPLAIYDQRRSHSHHERQRSKFRRADSLSEDLESLMSRSTSNRDENSKLSPRRRARSFGKSPMNLRTSARFEIDCVSPQNNTSSSGGSNKEVQFQRDSTGKKLSNKRLLTRLFGSTSVSVAHATDSAQNLSNSRGRRRLSQCDISLNSAHEPTSGVWGSSSLMDQNHASVIKLSNEASKSSNNRKLKTKSHSKRVELESSLKYTSLQLTPTDYSPHISNSAEHEQQSLEKYQSLNLYQNLLRNYAKRRHRHHSHHHQHQRHSHHHHHHHHGQSLSRHAHLSTRCGQRGFSCENSCVSGSNSEISGPTDKVAAVWGQLIKINKSDGSQVIELQRSAGKSWGFFVARGAINNVKGIFISRIHDSTTSSSLTGLLSIGDRILAIDGCPIEPDYDILRVNQLISKKSKILLKVKPFKG